jgi:hypothetical protein
MFGLLCEEPSIWQIDRTLDGQAAGHLCAHMRPTLDTDSQGAHLQTCQMVSHTFHARILFPKLIPQVASQVLLNHSRGLPLPEHVRT